MLLFLCMISRLRYILFLIFLNDDGNLLTLTFKIMAARVLFELLYYSQVSRLSNSG